MPVELDEINVRGLALVTGWDPHPSIDMDSRRGCLVTGTVSHVATTLSVLQLVGDDEPIIATPWHRVYSHTRGDWVAIDDLAAGELLRTADGTVAVDSVTALAGQREPVFNLEVAGSHRYFVHGRRVLTHNTYGAARAGRVTGNALKAARREFNQVKPRFWKNEAATNPGRYSPKNVARMRQGKAPIGSDGHPMELHHRTPLAEGGTNSFENLQSITRTEHRLGPNYKIYHPHLP